MYNSTPILKERQENRVDEAQRPVFAEQQHLPPMCAMIKKQ